MRMFQRYPRSCHLLRVSRKVAVLAMLAACPLTGCADDSDVSGKPCTTSIISEKLRQSSIDKFDILLAIDNSGSMADKQQILARTVPDLVQSITNPRCIDANGALAPSQPSSPLEICPPNTMREFPPIFDVHIGVISSSIGGHGADSCPNVDSSTKECQALVNTTNNDHGHLLSRSDQCGTGQVPTYANKGFLAWDPRQIKNPPGEVTIDDGMNGGLVPALRDMVLGTGQIGCGYESQLESVYRFLADPEPYDTIVIQDFLAVPVGTDAALLAQRAAFLRPDSLLAVIMLTDENDCSIKEYGSFYYVGQFSNGTTPTRLPRARQECAIDPNDPCCRSCGQDQAGCPIDATCKAPNGGMGPALLSAAEDNTNLRCWDQKRRFGIDFLYPTDRYVQAFSSTKVPNRKGELVDNPIFSDLNPQDNNSNVRDPGLVFFAGIVGVPWQDIARDKTDLKKGFKDAQELTAPVDSANPNSPNTWQIILGDPAKNIKPLDPLMMESVEKRSGVNPITGYPLVNATMPNGNPINGHEWTIPNDDLQYACIFPVLPGTERDCTNMNLTACDCKSKTNDNPLCAANPQDSNAPTRQVRAKAYPGIRPLAVLREMGPQGIVGSVCPAQLSDSSVTALDYGYRAAVDAIRNRLKPAFAAQCMSRSLSINENGQASCLIIEARNSNDQCWCDPAKARAEIPVNSDKFNAVRVAQQDPLAAKAGWDCFCEIRQPAGKELIACQQDVSTYPMVDGKNVNGWCYVDASASPPVGNPALVASCPESEKRNLRFVGESAAQMGATLFITCEKQATPCQ